MTHSLATGAFRRLSNPVLIAACATLAGCATLPTSGPTASAIVEASQEPKGKPGFAIVELTPEVVNSLQPIATAAASALASLPLAGAVDTLGPGDQLQISVFEVGAALFSGRSGAGALPGEPPPSAGGETLPPVTVAHDGAVTLPYVGRLQAAGLTTDALAARIQTALAGKSQAPQVVVSVRENLTNTAIVMGDVKKPGRIVLSPARERVLDAIALAGGIGNPVEDDVVHLSRGPHDAAVRLAELEAGSAGDIPLAPQDRVELLYRPRTFTVFGAAGKVSETPFQTPRVSLAEAMGRVGGPSEQQADATAVFVFRYEPSTSDGSPAEGAKPVAYRLNMMQAQSYFVAQRFEMRPRDVIYVANAESNQPAKMLQILNLFFQPIYTGKVVSQ